MDEGCDKAGDWPGGGYGYNPRYVIDQIDTLQFRSQTEKHELSHLYEAKIRNMGNAGRNGGEYYTPRPLIRAIVNVVAPRIGETIYDGACGSVGSVISVLGLWRGCCAGCDKSPRPAAVGVDHLIDFSHQADGFTQGHHNFLVMGDVVG